MADLSKIQVRYCSNPDGHAPRDCPDFPKNPEALRLFKLDREELAIELENMDIHLDDDELDEKIHDGTLMELL